MSSARELLQFTFDADAFARRAPRPIAIPQEIIANLERIGREHNSISEPPDQEDSAKIYHLFFSANRTGRLRTEFDSIRRIRQLAWALTYSEDKLPRIVDTPNLRDALQLIDDRFRISMLLSVFHALLKAWDASGAGLLRAFVRRHLADYDGRRRSIQNLRANLAWYCEENGATQLAMSLLRDQVNLSDVWSYLNLPEYTHGYRYFGIVGKAYVRHHFENNHRLERGTVADIIEFVKVHGDNKTSRAIVSKTIEKLGMGRRRICGNRLNPTFSENGKILGSLAGMYAGARFLTKRSASLRNGLRKKTFGSSLTLLPKPATIRNLPIEKPSGWRISNTSPFVAPCCAEMFKICLETTHKPCNTTANDNLRY